MPVDSAPVYMAAPAGRAVGLGVALGQLIAAIGMTLLALIVLRGIKVLEHTRQTNF